MEDKKLKPETKTRVEWKTKGEMIVWHTVNSILAGALVFVGAIADGHITATELFAALGASGIVALTKFREFWSTQKGTYRPHMFHFIH